MPLATFLRIFFLAFFAFIIFLFVSQSFGNTLKPWPSKIYYYNATGNSVIDEAAEAWGLKGLPRFVPTESAKGADLIVTYKRPLEMQEKCDRCLGYATGLGYKSSGQTVALSSSLHSSLIYIVTLHELGHILGLEHQKKGCYLMSTVIRPGCMAGLSPEDQYRLKLLYPDFSYQGFGKR